MRICYIAHADAHFLPPYVGYFSQAGHEVHVISPHPDDVLNATTHHPTGKNFDPMKASGWQYLIMIHRVKKLIRKINPDIVHAHYLTSNGMLAAMTGFKPLIVSARGSDVEYSMNSIVKRNVLRFILKKASLVNTVSDELANKLKELGVNNKLLVLPQGIEVSRFLNTRPRNHISDKHTIICTRKLFPVYQCDVIIHALRILYDRGIRLQMIFAATGPLEPQLRKLTDDLGLSSQVLFRGGYQISELPEILSTADIYVSASNSDGTSPCLLEAMAAGLFPVVSDIPANRLWLEGKGDGLLFPVENPDVLALCLEQAIGDSQLRQRALTANRQKVLERGDRKKNMEILHGYYKQLIKAR